MLACPFPGAEHHSPKLKQIGPLSFILLMWNREAGRTVGQEEDERLVKAGVSVVGGIVTV